MKIIEAMKRVKANKEKIIDLQQKISVHCANLNVETPLYGDRTRQQVEEWLQACLDIAKDNVELLSRIGRTNQATMVTIDLSGVKVTKPIAEWIWRRREYAAIDLMTFSKLTDRGLKEGNFQSAPGGQPTELKIIRHYDPVARDKMIGMFRQEPHDIDAALEVINATTDLLE